ncbi:hypothetical protein [Spiroplasma endosymbiont of Panorpa germanica]|uniref:hypothetical protein n=1 Tax=Spiroplasma endosymbiont of Panorpa germanica TaxID=3066314 RepID=UPI0030CA8214
MKLKIEKLNDKQRDFFDFYNNNFEKYKTMSIKDISKEYGCGISFVYNFFESIGVKGIKEFIWNISYDKGQASLNDFKDGSENQKLFKEIFDTINLSNLRNLELCNENNKDIEALITDIIKTKRRFCLGFGYSKLAALDFIGPFHKIDNSFILVNDENYENSKTIEIIRN